MNHRFTRPFATVGSHAIVVAERQHSPRLYQAVCKTCTFESAIGTASIADRAALAHRDENIEDFVTDQLADLLTPTDDEIAAAIDARTAVDDESEPAPVPARKARKS